ncbi:MAG: DUF1330 domain-containing protein [Ilumatobacteraceae bacterium]
MIVPKAYVVNQVVVHDSQRYAEYAALGRSAVAQYGGRVLAGGGRVETLEGEPVPPRVVVIEFADFDTAVAYYRSPEYQAAKAVRGDAATVRFAVVDGLTLELGVDGEPD